MVSCLEVPLSQARKAFCSDQGGSNHRFFNVLPGRVANLMWNKFARHGSHQDCQENHWFNLSSTIFIKYLENVRGDLCKQWAMGAVWDVFCLGASTAQAHAEWTLAHFLFHGKPNYRWWEGCTEKGRQRKCVNCSFFFQIFGVRESVVRLRSRKPTRKQEFIKVFRGAHQRKNADPIRANSVRGR